MSPDNVCKFPQDIQVPLNICMMLVFHKKLFFFSPKSTLADIHEKSRNCGSLMLEYGKHGFVLKNLFIQYKQIYKIRHNHQCAVSRCRIRKILNAAFEKKTLINGFAKQDFLWQKVNLILPGKQ